MKDKKEMENALARHIRQYGEWVYDIPLPHGLWTRGDEGIPHTRLRRVLQIVADTSLKPLSDCHVLDLGCLDGIFSIEFALHGANVTGLEVRENNIRKAMFVRDAYELSNINFVKDDVRNLSLAKYGSFDIILCSGLLYHLTARDALALIEKMHAITNRIVIIDTHISLHPTHTIFSNSHAYHGHPYREHSENDDDNTKDGRVLASVGNVKSFFFTRPSLINALSNVGFTSIYECFNPPHLNFGKPGLEHEDRCTFVAIKGSGISIHTSPLANVLNEEWPEGSLSYVSNTNQDGFGRVLRRTAAVLLRKLRS